MLIFVISVLLTLSAKSCGIFFEHPSPSSPKLVWSLSYLYLSRLAIREEDIYSHLRAHNNSSKSHPNVTKYLQDYGESSGRKGDWKVSDHSFLALRMVRRFVLYVTPLIQYFNETGEKELYSKLEEKEDVYYPKVEDEIGGVFIDIIAAQHVCNLQANDMKRGRFFDLETGFGLTPEISMEYAQSCLILGCYIQAWDWVHQPEISLLENKTEVSELKKEIIKKHDEHYENKSAEGDLYLFTKPMSKGVSIPLKHSEYAEWMNYGGNSRGVRERRLKNFHLCSRERPVKFETRLKCWNDFKKHPYFTLAPLRAELVSDKPEIWLFRNIVSDKVIRKLQEQSLPGLEDDASKPRNETTINNMNIAWLPNHNLTTPSLMPLLEATLSLNLKGSASDDFRSSLYQMLGDGDIHHDAYRVPNLNGTRLLGDRFATFLLYLNDVILGGETNFPDLDLKIQPEKGSILFWYNYKKNGNMDWLTHHGTCPPILGHKMYISCFVGMHDNMFKRPCSLDPNE